MVRATRGISDKGAIRSRKRKGALLLTMIMCAVVYLADGGELLRGERRRKVNRTLMFWPTRLQSLSDGAFLKRYKFTKPAFNRVVGRLDEYHSRRFSNNNRSVPVFMWGACLWHYGYARGWWKHILRGCQKNYGVLIEIYPFSFPLNDGEKLKQLEEGFAHRTGGVLRGNNSTLLCILL